MLFPVVDKHIASIIIGVGLGLVVTAVAIVLMGLNQSSSSISMAAATPTSTKTPTKPATSTPTPSPSATQTATPTATATPTNTSTATPTNTSTSTATPLPPTSTQVPPTATPVPPLVITQTVVPPPESVEITVEAVLTITLPVTLNTTLTETTTITPVVAGTPTPTPTPVPRTVQVSADIPNYTQAEDHFWFTRSFTNAYSTWGSYYYPYGTNARGQYFWHRGIDIQNPQNTPIVAAGNGTIIHAGPDDPKQLGPWPDFYGQAVVIEHSETWNNLPVYTLYGHVSKVLVRVGQQVETGDLIATVGQLGVALGPHLHFEVRLGAGTYHDSRNPDLWVRPDPGYGVIAGRIVDYDDYYVPQQLVTLHWAENPGKFWRQTFTYPDNVVTSDDVYGETFSFSDVPAGRYLVKTFFDGRQLTVPITVTNRSTSFILLKQNEPPLLPKISVPTPSPPITTTLAADQPPQVKGEHPSVEETQ